MRERIFIGIFPSPSYSASCKHASTGQQKTWNIETSEHSTNLMCLYRRRCEKVDSTETSRAASRYVERVQREFFSLSFFSAAVPRPPSAAPPAIQNSITRKFLSECTHIVILTAAAAGYSWMNEWLFSTRVVVVVVGRFWDVVDETRKRAAAACGCGMLICRTETTTTKWKPHTIRKTFSLDLGENSVCAADVVQEL